MAQPVFIVSTGRCGSTLLSNIVRQHPQWLSISEFFTSLAGQAFRGRSLDGEGLFQRLNTLSPGGQVLLRNGFSMDEFLYKTGPGARYRPEEVPPILCATLPHLSGQPEQLWDELAAAIRPRAKASLAEQYRFVFEWLARRYGKKTWFERSGASLPFVPVLARLFPEAKFVHLFRDGRDTAISMHRHPFFRLRVEAAAFLDKCGLDAFAPLHLTGTSPWIPYLERIRFRFFDAERFRNSEIDLAEFGRFWSRMILCGLEHLQALPPERTLSMRFESLLAAPEQELKRLVEFVDPEALDAGWLAEAVQQPRSKKPAWQALDAEIQTRLTEACRPGNALLEKTIPLPA